VADLWELRELVRMSQFTAGDVLLAQGSGSNVSIKSADGAVLWVKASGIRLAEVSTRNGYVETALPDLLHMMRDKALAGLPRTEAQAEAAQRVQQAVRGDDHLERRATRGPRRGWWGAKGPALRPSLETTSHAVLGRAVLHTQPVYVNAFTCMEGGEAALAEAMGEPAVWASYEPPGYALGREVNRISQAHREEHGLLPGHVLLRNHGLLASGALAQEAIETTERFVKAGRAYFAPLPAGARDSAATPALLQRWAGGLRRALRRRAPRQTFHFSVSSRAALLAAADDPEQWLLAGPLVPDDVVCHGRRVLAADTTETPSRWLERAVEEVPNRLTVAVNGCGVVLAGPSRRAVEAMEETLLAHVLVRWLIAARKGQARPLPPEEIDYLTKMEV
jgi:rhamnose utilization protein RhaD (predicted bifunctional aldolase and dehydrogenase)